MISLVVSYYAQDPHPVIDSALHWIPAIDNVVALEGRYEGFTPLGEDEGAVFASEHEKRNELLRIAEYERPPSAERWLLILDCDEQVTYASPQLATQLDQHQGDVAGIRFIEPLPPVDSKLGELLAGLGEPGRSVRDNVHPRLPRLIRHLPGLEYRHRHDFLTAADGRQLLGWESEGVERPQAVDLEAVHRWWEIPEERRNAKAFYYASKTRQAENVAHSGHPPPPPVFDAAWD